LETQNPMPPHKPRTATSVFAQRRSERQAAAQEETGAEDEDTTPPAMARRPRRERISVREQAPIAENSSDSSGGVEEVPTSLPKAAKNPSPLVIKVTGVVVMALFLVAVAIGIFVYDLSAPPQAPEGPGNLADAQESPEDVPSLWSPTEARNFSVLPDPRGDQGADVLAERARMIRSARLMSSERKEEAFAAAEAEALLAGDDPAAFHHAGVLAHAAGRHAKAAAYFRKSLDLEPRGSASLFNLAMLEFEMGDYAEAAENYNKYHKLNPSHRIAAYRLVVASILAGQNPPEPPPTLEAKSQVLLYALAAIAMHDENPGEATRLAESARLLDPVRAGHFEQDMRLLGVTVKSDR
jgi:hypothetical protein